MPLRISLILIALITVLLQRYNAQNFKFCYKNFCKCFISRAGLTNRAVCSGRELDYIPRLPRTILDVTFENTNLSSVKKNLFYNLTGYPIKKLNLSGNLLQVLDPESFTMFTHLSRLVLSQEPHLDVQVVKKAIHGFRSKYLTQIEMTFNLWNSIPSDMFDDIDGPQTYSIKLTGNQFHYFDFNVLKVFKRLEKLYLDSNNIEYITLQRLPNLVTLNMEGNILSKVPRFCNSNGESFFPMLGYLNLAKNGIGLIGSTSLNCLPRVQRLILNGINTGKLKNNTFSNMPELSELQLSKVGNPLKVIEPLAFNSSVLQILSLGLAKFHFDSNRHTYNPDSIFAHCRNLKYLDLRGNQMFVPRMDDKLARMLKPLTNLRSLTLSETRMVVLPKQTFTNLKSLETLNLDRNLIKSWNKSNEIFGNMTSLRHLSLLGNLITLVNETSFPNHLLQSLKSLHLEANPFSCTCEQMWFLNWTRSTKINIGSYPNFYKCAHPPNLKGISLKDYRPTNSLCNPWNPLVTVLTTLSSVILVIITVAVVVTRCQGNIKNCLYFLRVYQKRKQGYLRLDSDMDFEYDAFVVYCDADRNWVHHELLDKIENAEGMHLCIHHRNFDVGESIADNVDKCLRKSWKVIVVMSNNFCKSEWCQWEVDVIQGRRREKGKDAVVPILLENIDSKHMTGKIRTLLDATPYLTYKRGYGAEWFWKTLIESLHKPLGDPPISIL